MYAHTYAACHHLFKNLYLVFTDWLKSQDMGISMENAI